MSRQIPPPASSTVSAPAWKSSPIAEYHRAIQLGQITAGAQIRAWYSMVVRALEAGEYQYSEARYRRVSRFIESFCHHHEGRLAPQLIRLELWQRAFLAVVFGCVDPDGCRHFREAVLIVARKNGKTLFAAAIAEYMTILDEERGARIYFCAPKLAQAMLCYEAYYQMLRQEPEIDAMAVRRRTDIYFESSNSSAQPLPFAARKSDGMNPHLAVLDEVASWPGDAGLKQYEVLKSALGARTQPLLLSISTAGYVNEGIYDELMRRCTAVLKGTSRETRLAPFIYAIDDPEKWSDLTELRKSNPNLGVSVSEDYLREEIAAAEGSLSKKAEILTKFCNIKQNSSQAWLSAETVRKAFGSRLTLDDFRGSYALGGIDLSQTTDLTAACVLIERRGVLWAFCRFFLPSEKISLATERDGIPYQAMIERGLLVPSGDAFVDYRDCFNWFRQLVEEYQIYPLVTGYDRYSAQYLVQDMQTYGFHMESVFQGFNLTGVEDTFEGLLKSGQLRSAEDNDLLKIHMMDAAQLTETNLSAHPRKKLAKLSKYAHVDGVAAILDALCMRANHWAELGPQLKNEG